MDEVYGPLRSRPTTGQPTRLPPARPYPATEAEADMRALAYSRSFDLETVGPRCCNNGGRFHCANEVIPLSIADLIDGLHMPRRRDADAWCQPLKPDELYRCEHPYGKRA